MLPPKNEKPEEVIRRVATEIIVRAIKLGRKNGRTIYISKTSNGDGTAVEALNPATEEGRANLEKFFKPVKRQYTVYGLGSQEEKNSINWRSLNLPFWRRALLTIGILISLFMRGKPSKNRFLELLGAHIGKGSEIMQFVWLDHFRPELVFIGENTLVGAMSQLTVHAYEGGGRFRFGLIEVGSNCTLAAGTGVGPIVIQDNVRTLPGTILSPYFLKIREGSIVGWNKPDVRKSGEVESET